MFTPVPCLNVFWAYGCDQMTSRREHCFVMFLYG